MSSLLAVLKQRVSTFFFSKTCVYSSLQSSSYDDNAADPTWFIDVSELSRWSWRSRRFFENTYEKPCEENSERDGTHRLPNIYSCPECALSAVVNAALIIAC